MMAENEKEISWDMLSQGLVTEQRLEDALLHQRLNPGIPLKDALDRTAPGNGVLLGNTGDWFSGTTIIEGKENPALESGPSLREWNLEAELHFEPDTRFRTKAGDFCRFGKYYLGPRIGKGGSGNVYSAFQTDLGREVALKFPSSGDPGSLRQFISESHLAAKLCHPNIIRIFEVGQHRGILFFSMESIGGSSLDRLNLDPGLAVRALRDVAGAVDHVHRAGILHQDLKPQNIMMDRNGCVTLIDFGLACEMRTVEDTSPAGFIRGTPAYMSPEQIRGERVGPWSDIYSLGATLYRSVAGKGPFCGTSLKEVLEKVQREEPVALQSLQPGIPGELEKIVQKAMAKKPAHRYASAKAMATDLDRIMKQFPSKKRAG